VAAWVEIGLIRADARGVRPPHVSAWIRTCPHLWQVGETVIRTLLLTPGTAKAVANELKALQSFHLTPTLRIRSKGTRICASQYGDTKALAQHRKILRPPRGLKIITDFQPIFLPPFARLCGNVWFLLHCTSLGFAVQQGRQSLSSGRILRPARCIWASAV